MKKEDDYMNDYRHWITYIPNVIVNTNTPALRGALKKTLNISLATPKQGIIAALEGMKIRKDREQLFKNSAFEKLMIISKKDPVLDYNSLIKQTKNFDIKVVEFPDGHMSHVENETLFLHTIMHFIEKI